MKKIDPPHKNICDFHAEIIDLATGMIKITWSSYSDMRSLEIDIMNFVDEIVKNAEWAMVAGQKMEDRLSLYRDAIESLGFERKKND